MKQIAASLLAVLFFVSCNPGLIKVTEEETFTIEEVFKILDITSPVGNIDINKPANGDNGTDNASVIDVTVEKWALGETEQEAQEDIDKITVTHELDGDTYKVVVEAPFNDPAFNGGANLTFNNVREKQIVIDGDVGNIDCEEIAGGTIATDVGNISVDKATDAITLNTATGNITLGEASAAIEIATDAGNVEVGELTGRRFTLQSSTGNIGINVFGAGKVDGTAVTSTGSMALGLSKDLSCRVELSTDTGTISVEGADDVQEEADIEGINERVGFTLNEGEGSITGTVDAGNIDVQVE